MKISADFEFPRSWKDVIEGGTVVSTLTQPYVTGLYVSITIGAQHHQLGLTWDRVPKFLKELRKSVTITELNVRKLGDYLSADDIQFMSQ